MNKTDIVDQRPGRTRSSSSAINDTGRLLGFPVLKPSAFGVMTAIGPSSLC